MDPQKFPQGPKGTEDCVSDVGLTATGIHPVIDEKPPAAGLEKSCWPGHQNHELGTTAKRGHNIIDVMDVATARPAADPVQGLNQVGSSMATIHDGGGTVLCCSNLDKTSPAHEHQSLLSDSISQTRFHGRDGVIERLMPPGGDIYFGLDYNSFEKHSIPHVVIDHIVAAAIEVSDHINDSHIGVSFIYRNPQPSYNTFNIRFEPDLGENTLASADFPNRLSHKGAREVRISRLVVESDEFMGGLHGILAHEFGHLLGMRHWNAESDPEEQRHPSVHWPGTSLLSTDTVMTRYRDPPGYWFSAEDWKALRELYSAKNEDTVEGITIRDTYLGTGKDRDAGALP